MPKLLYISNTSLDGYVEDEVGALDWADPEGAFAFITELLQPIGTYFYGRRMYETMAYWDAPLESYPYQHRAFARTWQGSEKVVFSSTLTAAMTRNTRVERRFDAEVIRKFKRESEHDISIGGAGLAGLALKADLVDECHLFVHPVLLGHGKPAFPTSLRRNLQLVETRRFDGGPIYVRYRVHAGIGDRAR